MKSVKIIYENRVVKEANIYCPECDNQMEVYEEVIPNDKGIVKCNMCSAEFIVEQESGRYNI